MYRCRADIAFLVMELSFVGRRDLAESFADVYFAETNDVTGCEVLPLFAVYRSAVRAKVAAILGAESEISQADRDKALAHRAHWLWCLSGMEEPDRRPALVLVSGLPGTGKSTLSRMLADTARFEVLRSDVIRKGDLHNLRRRPSMLRVVFRRQYATGLRRMLDPCSQSIAGWRSSHRRCHVSAGSESTKVPATCDRLWRASRLAGMHSSGGRHPDTPGSAAWRRFRCGLVRS